MLSALITSLDAIQTRTPIHRMLPAKPSLAMELLLALPDAIGRTLLLTRFSVLPLLHSSSSNTLLPTPSSLILVPFILAVPFASLIFSATSFFCPKPHLSTPMELRPGGWMMVDAWAPVVIPALFLTLIGPVEGWGFGMGWGEDESVIVCMTGLTIIFALRAVYNFGYKKELWLNMLGLERKERLSKWLLSQLLKSVNGTYGGTMDWLELYGAWCIPSLITITIR